MVCGVLSPYADDRSSVFQGSLLHSVIGLLFLSLGRNTPPLSREHSDFHVNSFLPSVFTAVWEDLSEMSQENAKGQGPQWPHMNQSGKGV